jgi:hypothetical protein
MAIYTFQQVNHPSRNFVPLLIEHSKESIIRGGLLVVVPFFSVGRDEVFVITPKQTVNSRQK